VFPFLERVLVQEPQRLVAECELSVERHHFLRDHVFFGRNLSVTDAGLIGLPIMPLAVTLEIMAEAATLLHPGAQVTAIRDIRAIRWLAFETDTRRVRVEASLLGEGVVEVTASEVNAAGAADPIAEATFELRREAPESLGPPTVPEPVIISSWSGQEVYQRFLFHGPTFQGIRSFDSGEQFAARAEVVEPDPAGLVPAGTRPLLPVVLIDVSGQVAGTPLLHISDENGWSIVFPLSIQRVEFLAQRQPGQVLRTVTRAVLNATSMISDCEMVDEAGRVVVRVVRREEKRWQLPGNLFLYWCNPRERRFTQDLTHLFRAVPGSDRCTVCEPGNVADTILVNRFWFQVLTRMVLSRAEQRDAAAAKRLPVPAASWFLGRVAAKDAVRLRAGLDVCLTDVEIRNDANGRPEAHVPGGPTPLISLAHTGFSAVAAAVDAEAFAGVGIDLEPLASLPAGLKEDAFTPQERALIEEAAAAAQEPSDSWYLSAWGAKEAAGKTLGRGLLGGPLGLEVVAIDPQTGCLRVALRGPLAEAFPHLAREEGLDCCCRIHQDKVITLCLLPHS
jgi:phosphopantetheinyl transferase